MMFGDLHVHSTNSDGSVSIERLPIIAKAAGMAYLSVTDHDTLKSVRYARTVKTEGITMIPGVELTGMDYERNRLVHLLCYDPLETAELQNFCRLMKRRRNEAAEKRMMLVKEQFPAFTEEAAWQYSQDSGVLYKSSIIRVLYDYAYTDGIYKELYQKLFGKNGSCRVSLQYEDVNKVLNMAKRAKGVVVFAHPSVYDSMELCKEWIRKEKVDGVEICHPRNTASDRIELLNLAQEYGFLVTGGTDFHGINMAQSYPIGTCTTVERQINRLCKLSADKKKQTKCKKEKKSFHT